MKYLVVNADDYGESPGVTEGILEVHRDGVLTSTSMIVTSPYAEEAADRARSFPDLSVGLHVCLTNNKEQAILDLDDAESVRSEVENQLARFTELNGSPPTHVDSHHNIHRDPRVENIFVELAKREGLLLREHSPVRYYSSFYGQWDGITHLEQISVEMLRRMLREEVEEGFTEIACHPARPDAILESFYLYERRAELQTLTDPSVRKAIEDLHITLIGFRDVPNLMAENAQKGARA